MKILLATHNEHKLAEFRAILEPEKIDIIGLSEMPDKLVVEETGITFLENAVAKATAAFHQFGLPTVADDSGLEVDALDNKPGVYSARFAGKEASDEDNNARILKLMEGIPQDKRKARFVCLAVFLSRENDEVSFSEGSTEGEITLEPRGSHGFGYDPLFYYPPLQKTFAEMTSKEKNTISHRKKAIQGLAYKIIAYKNRFQDQEKT